MSIAFPPSPQTQSDGIWIIDAEGKTLFANDFMAEIWVPPHRELSSQDSFLYVFPEDLPAAQRLFATKQAGSDAPLPLQVAPCRRKPHLG